MTDSWDKLKIWQFREIMALPDGDEDRYFKILAILNECTYEEILEMPIQQVSAMKDKVAFLNETPRIKRAKRTYKLGDTEYRFTYNLDEITTAQYMDLSNTPDDFDHILDLLAICLVPEGNRYGEGYRFDDVKKDVNEHMTLEEARAVTGFFIGRFLLYLEEVKRKARKALRKAVKAGAITKEKAEETRRLLDQNPLLDISGFVR